MNILNKFYKLGKRDLNMSKKAFIGRKLREARMYRGKTIDILAKETNINKKDIIAFEEDKYNG